MSYYDTYLSYKGCDWDIFFTKPSDNLLLSSLGTEEVTIDQFTALLSPSAKPHIEAMAHRAHELTLKYFGRTIQLYTPLYLSNYCDNACVYCGFNKDNAIARRLLSAEEIEKEASAIATSGLKHILVLTGESRRMSPISYIKDSIKILRKYFASISVEIYALTETEYAELVAAGADSLTIYQEAYDEKIYEDMHPAGPKSDYMFRLDAPERGARAGMRTVNIGALFGLDDWRKEAFLMARHAKYLQDKFPDIDIGASIPRLQPHAGNFISSHTVTDADIVQVILALRIFLPRLSITVSTRESAGFRENILPLGITRMSAGSSTCVGGHTTRALEPGERAPQFEISDMRDVDSVKEMLKKKGYQPVIKDWLQI